MNWKAVGLETKKTYIVGTHADCSRYVNDIVSRTDEVDAIGRAVTLRHVEPIQIVKEGQHVETDAEKELELLRIKFEKEALAEKVRYEAEKAERERRRKALQMTKEAREAERIRKVKAAAARKEANRWPEEAVAFLVANYRKLTRKQMAEHLGKTRGVVDSKLNQLLKTGQIQRENLVWTQKQDAFIIENYGEMKPKQIGQALGIPLSKVRSHIANLKYAGKL